jgi:hypothetical protein
LTNAAGGTRLSLSHLKQLGVNALWLQPIHPRGIDGRQIDPATNRRFELGSPYAAKNYFAVMPLMASGFTPGASPAANDTPQGRVAALTEFENFVKAAKAQHITVFLDVPFNHTAHDTELAPPGQHYWGDAGTTDTSEIRAVEARIFSRSMNMTSARAAPVTLPLRRTGTISAKPQPGWKTHHLHGTPV